MKKGLIGISIALSVISLNSVNEIQYELGLLLLVLILFSAYLKAFRK